MSRSDIIEKVKFWEEQDKINEALIPRVFEIHDTLKKVTHDHVILQENVDGIEVHLKNITKRQNLNEEGFKNLKKLIQQNVESCQTNYKQLKALDEKIESIAAEVLNVSKNTTTEMPDEREPGVISEGNNSGLNKAILVLALSAVVISIISLFV